MAMSKQPRIAGAQSPVEIWASDFRRTRETAEVLAGGLNCDGVCVSLLTCPTIEHIRAAIDFMPVKFCPDTRFLRIAQATATGFTRG